jgi:hypothetical protein
MKTRRLHCAGVALLTAGTAAAVTFNQVDDFEGGDVAGWTGGKFGPAVQPQMGGPAGGGDTYLEIATTGFHLGANNTAQWTGDFLAAGVTGIAMDLNHLSPVVDPVQIRILLFGAGGPFASVARTPSVTTNTWSRYVFDLSPTSLVHVPGGKTGDGTGVLVHTLTNVTTLLIRHDAATPTPPGDHPPHVTETLGIDNIHAVPLRPTIAALVRTDPTNATLHLSTLLSGLSNRVETVTNLLTDTWGEVTTFVATGSSATIAVETPPSSSFYRVALPGTTAVP